MTIQFSVEKTTFYHKSSFFNANKAGLFETSFSERGWGQFDLPPLRISRRTNLILPDTIVKQPI